MERSHAGLSRDEAETLQRDGMVRLPGIMSAAEADHMADRLWRRLEARHRHFRDRPETWTKSDPRQLDGRSFGPFGGPAVRAVVDDLLGVGGWQPPQVWGTPLVTFPTPGPWDVPHRVWHTDLPARPDGHRIARLFAILTPLEPQGGGTVYVAGSHLVLRKLAAGHRKPIPSRTVKTLLVEREPWFADLLSRREGEDRLARFMGEGATVDGVRVQVREITGDPGDLYVMDPMMLHALAQNTRAAPRLMLTQAIVGHGWQWDEPA